MKMKKLRGSKEWALVRDFMSDRNGTFEHRIKIAQSELDAPIFGSCGLRPDMALMEKEPISKFDLLADGMGWDCRTRKLLMKVYEKIWSGKKHGEAHSKLDRNISLYELNKKLKEAA